MLYKKCKNKKYCDGLFLEKLMQKRSNYQLQHECETRLLWLLKSKHKHVQEIQVSLFLLILTIKRMTSHICLMPFDSYLIARSHKILVIPKVNYVTDVPYVLYLGFTCILMVRVSIFWVNKHVFFQVDQVMSNLRC